MTCTKKLFIARAYDIPLTISTGNSLTVGDISDISLTFTLISNPATTVNFTYLGGGISISGSTITLLVLEGSIATAGDYSIAIDVTDTGGKVRGITPCPARLTFHNQ